MKKIDYSAMFTLRKDGRYQGYWHELVNGEPVGTRHTICDRDPKRLYDRIIEKETPRAITFSEAAERWWDDHVEKELARGSRQTYRAVFNYVVSELEDLALADVDAAQVNRLLLMEKTAHRSKKHASTVRSIIKQIFDYAIINKHVATNPTAYVSIPSGLRQTKKDAPEEDMIETVKANLDKPFGMFVALLLYTGMRTEEAVALTWGDVGEKYISVNKAVDLHGTPLLKETKTEAGERKIPILDPLRPYLQNRRKDEEYLFANKGKLLTRGQISTLWINWCKEAGLAYQKTYYNRRRGKNLCVRNEWRPLITPHDLRHNFATVLYEANVDILAAKTVMGHKDIETTRSIYTSVRDKHLMDELDKIKESF